MKFIKGLSADMDDLLSKKGQTEALDFFNYVCWCVKNDVYEMLPTASAINQNLLSQPQANCADIKPTEDNPSASAGKKTVHVLKSTKTDKKGDVVIVTNCEDDDTQLQKMIARFQARLPRKTRVVNIAKYPFIGGCLGCFHCAVSGKCIYKDDFDTFLRNEIQKTQAIVYAFTIKDHSMGSSFKLYDDRQFCNGHRTVTMGMPVGYIVSGNLSVEANLQTIIEARAQVGSNFLAGVATDEIDPDREIDQMAAALHYALKTKHHAPQNFYGIGGMKIFRDLIWIMQGMMKADHKFYKAHGQYDFPQKQWPTMLKMYLVGSLLSSPELMKKAGNAMNEGMIAPYKKILEEL